MPDGTASLRLAGLCLTAMICFDDLGGAVAAAREALAVLPAGSPVRSAVQALSAWHAHLLGDAEQAQLLARDALAGQVHLPSAGLPLVAYLPVAVLALAACERGDLDAAAGFAAEAVAARDSGPLRGAPHSLPVVCASARVLTLRGDAEEAATRCLAGLELARDWRDSSLMVPRAAARARASACRARPGRGRGGGRASRPRADRRRARRRRARRGAGGVRARASARRRHRRAAPGAGALTGGAAGRGPPRAARNGADELSSREVEVLRALARRGQPARGRRRAVHLAQHDQDPHARALRQARRRDARGGRPPRPRARAARPAR